MMAAEGGEKWCSLKWWSTKMMPRRRNGENKWSFKNCGPWLILPLPNAFSSLHSSGKFKNENNNATVLFLSRSAAISVLLMAYFILRWNFWNRERSMNACLRLENLSESPMHTDSPIGTNSFSPSHDGCRQQFGSHLITLRSGDWLYNQLISAFFTRRQFYASAVP